MGTFWQDLKRAASLTIMSAFGLGVLVGVFASGRADALWSAGIIGGAFWAHSRAHHKEIDTIAKLQDEIRFDVKNFRRMFE